MLLKAPALTGMAVPVLSAAILLCTLGRLLPLCGSDSCFIGKLEREVRIFEGPFHP